MYTIFNKLLFLVLVFLIQVNSENVFSQKITQSDTIKTTTSDNSGVFIGVDKNAQFQGGDINSFHFWVIQNTFIPDSLKKKEIHGTIIVQFVVDSLGIVENAKILKGIDSILDNEVIHIVMSSPKWIPGKL